MYKYLMYVHSLVVKKDLQLRHEAIVRVEKKTVNQKTRPKHWVRANRGVCAGQWTMDMMIWISSSLDICTYVYIPYVRSGQVRSSRDRTYICRNPAARQKILSNCSIHTRIPRPNEKYQRCEDHRPTVSRLFFFQFQFTSRPALPPALRR